jgi:hypothetical protein
VVKEALTETHFFPFFFVDVHPRLGNCQGRRGKNLGGQVLALAHGQQFCNFAFFVPGKSKVSELVKRDLHFFDLVIFLHPKKC